MQVLVLEQEGKTSFDKLILLNQKHKLNLELMHQPITKPRDKILQTIVKEHLNMPILLLEKGIPHLVHHNEKTITKTALNWQSLTQRIVRALQSEKALFPIVVTLLGMVIEAREEQPRKAQSPIVVTPLGMVTEVRERQS